jgi:type IV pilus assembly protein PilP
MTRLAPHSLPSLSRLDRVRAVAPRVLGLAAVGLFVAFSAGCEAYVPPPMPVIPPKPDPGPTVEESSAQAQADEEARLQYFYTPIGKRDPFRPYYLDIARATPEQSQAEEPRLITPLERFEVEQLKVVAVVSGISTPRAMIEAPNGKGYIVRPGTPIGRNGGRVARIKRDELIVEEEYLDSNARRVLNRIRMRLRVENTDLE